MILIWIIIVLMLAGLLAWFVGRWSDIFVRVVCLVAMLVQLAMIISIWWTIRPSSEGKWILQYTHVWIPSFGIQIKLAVDGLSLLMLLLTSFLGVIAILTSWSEIRLRVGFFHFNLMFILAGVTAVFLSMDLFLFYFSWEFMLLPMFFLIGIWGHEDKTRAAIKFFLFTQASGLFMFVSILGLYFIHGHNTGRFTFDYEQLLGTDFSTSTAFVLMLGFVIAFMVKLSTVPFHSWLPDVHTQAPTAGSIILAGLLLKTGAYGLIRLVLPLFPRASHQFAPIALALGVFSILYGAKLAFAQTDLKRLIAYISVSHMGFILIGIYAFNEMAMQGTVVQMIAHGMSTGALFMLVGAIYERLKTREMDQMGGLMACSPRMGFMALVFVMASLGLPGLGNFVAEILIMIGAFTENRVIVSMAAMGLVASSLYALRIMQNVFYGEVYEQRKVSDLDTREMIIMASLAIAITWIGLFPTPVLNMSGESVHRTLNRVATKPFHADIGKLNKRSGISIRPLHDQLEVPNKLAMTK